MEELYNKTGILHFALCSVLIVATLLFPIECDSCPSDEFQCNFTKKCIPQSYKCDGDHWDCGPNDTSDENGCGNCTHGQYRCKKSKKCIDITYVCDEDKDCGDGDTHDEFNCLSCSRGKFHCPKSKKCISHDFRCNGIYGCDDKSDEDNCETCSPNVFHCNTSKRCLNSTKRCNGKNDCGSGDISDDLNCVNGCTGGFWCSVSLECVPSNKTCDLRADCMDASDENDCPHKFIVKQEVGHHEDNSEALNCWEDAEDEDLLGKELLIKKEDDLDIDPVSCKASLRLPLNQKSKRSHKSIRKAKSSKLRSRSSCNSKNPNLKCTRCGKIFRQYSELKAHLSLHSKSDQNGNEFDCPFCKYPCFSETNLRQHKARKHKHASNYPCDICGYLAPGKKRLARHRKLHENLVAPKTYQCDLCQGHDNPSSQFSSYLSFTRHQRLNHAQELGITLYKCLQCPSVYTTNKMLQDHVLHVHENNSRWCCEICGKGLLSENNLKEHLTTHEPKNRTEICYVCGVDFLNERTLREHVRKFHPDYSRHCRGGGSSGKSQDQPKVSGKEENEEDKLYKCLYCTFTSPFRLVVMRHRKDHKEVFRHNCEICGNGYSTQSSLKLHKKISHGDGGHVVKCDWCGKSFAHKHYLQNHQPRCKMRPVGVNLERNRKPFKDTLLVNPDEVIGDEDKVVLKKVKVPRKKKDGVKSEDDESSGPKLMICKYCNTFKTDNRGKMYGHVMQEHRDSLEFKYSCHLCGMRYTSKPSLTRHMVIVHPSDNKAVVNCQFCEKQFRHWSLLRVHYKFWCKAMPEGAPIPEPPNKKCEGKGVGNILSGGKEDKRKEPKFRVERKRSGGTRTRKTLRMDQELHFESSNQGLAPSSSTKLGDGVTPGAVAALQMISAFVTNPSQIVGVQGQQQQPSWW